MIRSTLSRTTVFCLWLLLAACSAMGVQAPKTFNERAAVALVTITTARYTAATLLEAGQISVSDAENVQQQADTARAGVDIAREIHASDPGAADDRLGAILTGLNALAAYLQSRGHP